MVGGMEEWGAVGEKIRGRGSVFSLDIWMLRFLSEFARLMGNKGGVVDGEKWISPEELGL